MKKPSLLVLTTLACLHAACASAPTLSDAARRGDADEVARLLDQGDDPNATNADGRTALMLAAGAPLRGAVVGPGGELATGRVPSPGHAEVVRELLARGADPNRIDRWGQTALTYAALSGNEAVARALLDSGAAVDFGRDRGTTPLLVACSEGHALVARLLLAAGADLRAADPEGQTPLMTATFGGHLEVLELLIGAGASLDVHDRAGNTALMNGAYAGRLDAVRRLVEAGAPLDSTNAEAKTALAIARDRGHEAIAGYLASHGSGR